MKRLISLCFLLMFLSSNTEAKHILGGNMTYRTVSMNGDSITLQIRLTVYRDANGAGADFDQMIDLGIYSSDGMPWQVYIILKDIPISERTEFELGNLPFVITDEIPSFQSAVYSAEITLPRSLGVNYLFAYQRCCRVDNLVNIVEPESAGFGIQLIVTDDALQVENDSPQLYDIPPSISVLGVDNELELPVSEPDGDLLTFSFCPPLVAGGLSGANKPGNPNACDGVIPDPNDCLPPFDTVNFISPQFTIDMPFGLENGINLNAETGTLTGAFNNPGIFNYGICIKEERDNTLLSEVIVDHTLFTDIYELKAIIRGKPFYDINQNGVKETEEEFLKNIKLGLNLDTLKSEIKSDNTHLFYVNEGQYNMIIDPDYAWSITNDSTIYVNELGLYYDHNPGLYPNSLEQSIRINALYEIPICNSVIKTPITLKNTGTLPITGTLCLKRDSLLEYNSAIGTPPDIITEDSLVWNIDNIDIDETHYIQAFFDTPDENALGELFELDFIFRDDSDNILAQDSLYDIIFCSADPNDKIMRPYNYTLENNTLLGTPLDYLIRFENIGNYVAFRVIIIDLLPEFLDPSTIEVLASTHEYNMSIEERKLIFTFDPIVLQPEEQGAIRFRIHHIEGLEENTLIRNNAKIYFDSNSPIVTRYTRNTMVSTTTNTNNEDDNTFLSIYPNPSNGNIHLRQLNTDTNYNYEILNIHGHVFIKGEIKSGFHTIQTNLNAGLYFLILKNTSGQVVQTEKLFIE